MKPCHRGPAPELLLQHGPAIAREYAENRRLKPAFRFRWPQRDGESLYEVTRSALTPMTDGRCAYCDGHPIDALGEEQIDHFRPKSREEFYELVCTWENLFLICSACNKAKLDQWEPALLRPDDQGFEFLRYFSYRTDSGRLEPNPAAPADDQQRARRTIEILDLNRAGLCTLRRSTLRTIRRSPPEEWVDLGCRYLVPLCCE